MEILRIGYIRFTGPINTQYLLGSRETDKHKALADYFGFFGFDFDPYIPEEIRGKKYIRIPLSSSFMEDAEGVDEILNSIATNYVIDPGCLYSLHKAFDTTTTLKGYRWKQPQFVRIKHFNFITCFGFDLDGSMFIYLIFDDLYELPNDLTIHDTDQESLAKLLDFYAPTPPGGASIFHLNKLMEKLVSDKSPITSNMRDYPRASDYLPSHDNKYGTNIQKYIHANGIKKPSKLYVNALAEAIENLYK